MSGLRVAVAGATGAVGREILSILAQRKFPASEVIPLASERSEGSKIPFAGGELTVRRLGHDSFEGVQLALFSAGASRSLEFAPSAVKAGAVVVDNSSAYRMDPEVPLVVPEVNAAALAGNKGIIANPNCSTIQMVVVLKPIHDKAGLRRIVVSTYQAVSGAGKSAMDELGAQIEAAGRSETPAEASRQIAFNCLPQIDVFLDGGDTKEEQKMVNETRKILGSPKLPVSATCVRVPVYNSHSESVNVETEGPLSPEEARELLSNSQGIEVVDDPDLRVYPTALLASGQDPVYVGRIRRDSSVENALNMWIVSDNLRKGAALNAVQIAEALIEMNLLKAA
ncbi:MAG: aspartate-semialdehyde dehydrogenase [Nitrospinaceae bacterium]|mgnify:FL=1|nr:aspartate-semialdehyde dehydrogenase [Nitrospinaceae bacterium]MBT5366990.1 aspartate-semialdehyde dehydrogenase [Nitrospinaceae bacterium]MBT5948045.1 aspartate-semialdehyde dehydrogenase [Nitrospinaceae bacterium]MBT6396694.1 aspartate-semialdehyde dehydrogenase [Nitrospinaceae bacterium]MBT7856541.1 aspartate-semialdehyde dehydrogenase [Nitrospinaceae bacterium]